MAWPFHSLLNFTEAHVQCGVLFCWLILHPLILRPSTSFDWAFLETWNLINLHFSFSWMFHMCSERYNKNSKNSVTSPNISRSVCAPMNPSVLKVIQRWQIEILARWLYCADWQIRQWMLQSNHAQVTWNAATWWDNKSIIRNRVDQKTTQIRRKCVGWCTWLAH